VILAKKALLVFLGLTLLAGVLATASLPGEQPRLPCSLGGADGLTVAGAQDGGPLQPGDRIRSVSGVAVENADMVAFILDGNRVGQTAAVEVERGAQILLLRVELARSITGRLLFINTMVSFLLWLVTLFVVLKGAADIHMVLFASALGSLTAVMFVYYPENTLGLPFGRAVSNVLSNGLYPFTVAFLAHFSMIFPERAGTRRPVRALLYLPALGLAASLMVSQTAGRSSLDPDWIRLNLAMFGLLRLYLGAYLLLCVGFLARNFLSARRLDSRQRLKWIFWGTITGIAPHVLLFELPRGLGGSPILPEEITYLLVCLACLAVGVAVVRHRFLDVDLIINRSLVYFALTVFVVLAYLLLVALGDWAVVSAYGEEWIGVRVIVALLLAALFAPLRQATQHLVDRLFYREQVDQRAALIEYSERLGSTVDIDQLLSSLDQLVERVMPVRWMRVFVHPKDGAGLRQVFPRREGATFLADEALRGLDLSGPLSGAAVAALPVELAGAAALVPLRSGTRLQGLIALGPRASDAAFSDEDVKFLSAVAGQTSVAFENALAFETIRELNINLEQKVFERTRELAEANDRLAEQYLKLQRLDELKEALSGMVVHDLKNPLATIMMGLEFIESEDLSRMPEALRHTLSVIGHTCRDMLDLTQNLLDITRLESGRLDLKREAVAILALAQECVERVRILARSREVVFDVAAPELDWPMDRSMMQRVLVNLLSNSIKFAPRQSKVVLDVRAGAGGNGGGELCLGISNSGPPIPPEHQQRIFERFAPVERRSLGPMRGTGLGLAFCRMVVEAHGGRIAVVSPLPGASHGARFEVRLPGGAAAPGA